VLRAALQTRVIDVVSELFQGITIATLSSVELAKIPEEVRK
jgi:hypothetical protein